ncbi:unnamed protein product [Rotaria magnacalcarata]|uniref:Uncharacterized protein n=2 Tax=Rotaria magnacalcarata TaxID=392030 RepID=A0A819DZX9_9BILA|nr:unnamed protein product [Rotaria magnacalcarata]
MSSMVTTTTILPNDTANYSIVVPISVGFAILAVICSALILVTIVSHRRRMHTANHLLIGDTCAWSIFCCAAQSNHFILIGIQWILAMLVSSPAIVTTDIFFRPHSVCWVTRIYLLHTYYTFVAYYFVPTLRFLSFMLMFTLERGGERQQDRDFKVFRNIMILFGIYLSGGIPTATVAVKNSVTLFLDRELFNALKKFIRRRNTRVMPALS